MDELDKKINAYEKALTNLARHPSEDYAERVREMLLARDDIAFVLKDGPKISSKQHKDIADVDTRLKAEAGVILNSLAPDTLAHWRDVNLPPTESWWWFLDQRLAETEEATKAQ